MPSTVDVLAGLKGGRAQPFLCFKCLRGDMSSGNPKQEARKEQTLAKSHMG